VARQIFKTGDIQKIKNLKKSGSYWIFIVNQVKDASMTRVNSIMSDSSGSCQIM